MIETDYLVVGAGAAGMAVTDALLSHSDASVTLVERRHAPGGSAIIQYVTKTLVSALDWNFDAQQATAMVIFGASNSPTTSIGGEHPKIDVASNGANDALVTGLRAMGHTVSLGAQSSGVGTILRLPDRKGTLQGGADPRREGLVLGDTFTP